METELDIIESLSAIGYKGNCLQNDVLTSALEGGSRSADFRGIVTWLAHELHVLRKTDEKVDKDVNDPSEFSMELSAMIKELGCPYQHFVAGPLSGRFQTKQSRIALLEYLITELMTTKMCLKLKPAEGSYIIPKIETDTARSLELLTKDLCLGKPPENVAPRALFDKVNFRLEEMIKKTNKDVLCESLLKPVKPLSSAQWKKLEEICASLDAEYNMRRQVLFTRLEVTIQSFQWSDKMRNREDQIVNKYQMKIKDLDELKYGGEDTNIVALLAARTDLAIIEKTSSANVRKNTATKIQKHVIGRVPDRGGRANEHAPPPPEMPSWQQQRASGPAGGGRGGRGGGGGGFQSGRGGGAGGGSGHWQQGGNDHFKTRPQQQSFEQRSQFDNQNWVTGSGRVQGTGWSQKGSDRGGFSDSYNDRNNHDNSFQKTQGGGGGGNPSYGGGNSSYGSVGFGNSSFGGGQGRGRSTYNRGGGGGGHNGEFGGGRGYSGRASDYSGNRR